MGRRNREIMNKIAHIPVLLQPTIEGLNLKAGNVCVDATLGLGGHAMAICEVIGKEGTLIGIDQDGVALKQARERLADCPARKIFRQGNFREMAGMLDEEGISAIDAVLFDLGFSSAQMESSGRGFSFLRDESLLMTLADKVDENILTARDIVNGWPEDDLEKILREYGEERFARRIAGAIVRERRIAPIETSGRLVEVVTNAVPVWYRHRRINPSTKTFQALRIAVNDELDALKDGLQSVWTKLRIGGRLSVISFHSLEARSVKEFMKEKMASDSLSRVINKPIKPSRTEQLANPRSRSAQLRIFEKVN